WIAGAPLLVPQMFLLWREMLMYHGSYIVIFDWFDQAYAILWVLTLALFLGFGLVLALLKLTSQRGLPAVTFGAACGIILMSHARNHFTEAATAADYVGSYGVYAMAPI